MKRYLSALLMMLAVIQPVWADQLTAVLAVPGMSCSACPITIKMALNKITGVIVTTFDIDNRQASVRFDSAKTNVEILIRAIGDAGYPATLLGLKP